MDGHMNSEELGVAALGARAIGIADEELSDWILLIYRHWPTARLLRGYRRAGVQNNCLGESGPE